MQRLAGAGDDAERGERLAEPGLVAEDAAAHAAPVAPRLERHAAVQRRDLVRVEVDVDAGHPAQGGDELAPAPARRRERPQRPRPRAVLVLEPALLDGAPPPAQPREQALECVQVAIQVADPRPLRRILHSRMEVERRLLLRAGAGRAAVARRAERAIWPLARRRVAVPLAVPRPPAAARCAVAARVRAPELAASREIQRQDRHGRRAREERIRPVPRAVLQGVRCVPGGARVIWSGCPRFFVCLSSSSSAALGCSRDVPPGRARVFSCSGCPRFFLGSSRFLSGSVLGARVDVPGGARVLSCSGCPRLEVSSAVLSNSVEVLRSAPNGGRELPHLLAPEPDTSLHCNTHAPTSKR